MVFNMSNDKDICQPLDKLFLIGCGGPKCSKYNCGGPKYNWMKYSKY